MTEEQQKEIAEYIQKYAKKHGVTPEEAAEHAICQIFTDYKKSV